MDIIKVVWKDIITVRETNCPEKEELLRVNSVGYEVMRDRKVIKICQSFSNEDGVVYKDMTIIPMSVVIKIKKLAFYLEEGK